MTKVFIGGSRKISRLNADVRGRIDGIIEKRLPVVIGDANGADKAVQKYLYGKDYSMVEVYCAGDHCRNNFGGWPMRRVLANGKHKNFAFYTAKDRVMAEEASVGLMIWECKSVGTLMNMFRLIRQQKKVVVYLAPINEFIHLMSEANFEALVLRYAPSLQQRIAREFAAEQKADSIPLQANLL